MARHPWTIPPGTARALSALLAQWASGEAMTIDAVVARDGRSKTVVYNHLVTLRAHGLIRWEDGLDGTLRPAIAIVPVPGTVGIPPKEHP